MNWSEYVSLARSLTGAGAEAADRSAISRAYYGAFNRARRWLEVHDEPIANHRAHEQVWRTFRAANRAAPGTRDEWQKVGELGGALRLLRNLADYADAGPAELEKEAARSVRAAEQILRLLPELRLAD